MTLRASVRRTPTPPRQGRVGGTVADGNRIAPSHPALWARTHTKGESESCAWCGATFALNAHGRPRVYCGAECRRLHNYHAANLPRWQAELAVKEAAAAGYPKVHRPVPAFLASEITQLRDTITRKAHQ